MKRVLLAAIAAANHPTLFDRMSSFLRARRAAFLPAAVLAAALAVSALPAHASTVLLGNSGVASSQDSDQAGTAEAFPVAAAATGTATQLSVYLDAGSTADAVTVGIYSDSGSGDPGTLLGKGVISSPSAGAWNTVTVSGIDLASGRRYWLAVLGTGGMLAFRDEPSGEGPQSQTSLQDNLSTLPASWSSGESWQTGDASLYAAG